jgi:hypothetical protein
MVRALTESGRSALGIDVSGYAVNASMRKGALALRARIEDPLPAEGRWGTVLLMDGNVGIGGSVADLLARCRQLVAPGGLIICEVDPVGSPPRPGDRRTPQPVDRLDAARLEPNRRRCAGRGGGWTGPVDRRGMVAGDRVFVALRRGM